MPLSYTNTLSNSTPLDASVLMASLNELKTAAEGIETTELDFLSESSIAMSAAGGHTHNGTDARGMIASSASIRGGLLTHSATSFIGNLGSYDNPSGTLVDFNNGSSIDTILAVTVMWRDIPNAQGITPNNAPSSWMTYNAASPGGSGADKHLMFYWVIDDSAAKDKLNVYAKTVMDTLFNTLSVEVKVWLLGI